MTQDQEMLETASFFVVLNKGTGIDGNQKSGIHQLREW